MKKPEKELREQKKKVEDFSKELKEYSDEELDNVAGGFIKGICSIGYRYEAVPNRCVPQDG